MSARATAQRKKYYIDLIENLNVDEMVSKVYENYLLNFDKNTTKPSKSNYQTLCAEKFKKFPDYGFNVEMCEETTNGKKFHHFLEEWVMELDPETGPIDLEYFLGLLPIKERLKIDEELQSYDCLFHGNIGNTIYMFMRMKTKADYRLKGALALNP